MIQKMILLSSVILIFFTCSVLSADYIVTISKNVNIRTEPYIDAFIIGRAKKGDLFKYQGETEKWYKIEMFSGEIRYIGKTVSARLTKEQILPGHNMILPDSEKELKMLCKAISDAIKRSEKEADEIIPISISKERHNNYLSIRKEINILYIIHQYNIQPVLYSKIIKKTGKI